MQQLELLAPAKNLECGKAAIDHGADAVYIGAQRFGARAAAGNSLDDIAELTKYAHLFGAKVYVTVNTIIYDDEIETTLQLINDLNRISVDAILIQDMGLYSLLNNNSRSNYCPPPSTGRGGVGLHASTQTDNRSIDKVKWLASLGFKRIVLARELSIEEISEIHKAVPEVELEVFVHGALCVSYSGQCYASEYCFNRSANRGECAQFCRLAFTLKDATGRILEDNRHLLSLKDMAQIDNLERLAEAGAVSFKIEGRLKDVDYVKNVTAAYSQRLDEIVAKQPQKYRRASFGHCSYAFTPDIVKSFNRGFTTYFADGRQQNINGKSQNANGKQQNLVSFDTPKAMGEYVGKVKEIRGRSFNVAGTASFANGDGLCFLDHDRNLIGFRVNKVEGNRIFPLRMPYELKPGTMLFRNFDQAFNSIMSKPTAERKVNISFTLSANGNSLTLTANDECGRRASVTTECELQRAEKPQEDNIKRQLTKLGGTIFECQNIEILTDAFIPSSILTAMRRDVTEQLAAINPQSITHHTSSTINTPQSITHHTSSIIHNPSPISPHHYPIPYLYNASNAHAKAFYKELGVDDATAFETSYHGNTAITHGDTSSRGTILMQCRYCLRNEMGYCTKNGKRAPWKEPLTISISDGREFQLQFDCKHCQMNVSPLPPEGGTFNTHSYNK